MLSDHISSMLQSKPETFIPSTDAPHTTPSSHRLKILSFNIQAGIHTHHYHQYVTRCWQHVLPSGTRSQNLKNIGHLLAPFDIIALQEADGGSLRSGFTNQIHYLAHIAKLPFWHQQLNRNLGRLGQHSNGLLSRYHPLSLENHKLPGRIPGRGAIIATFAVQQHTLCIVTAHLALSKNVRNQQINYIQKKIRGYTHVIVMGDMNASWDCLKKHSPLGESNLLPVLDGQKTYPSWQPRKALDHILVSPTITIHDSGVLTPQGSDHLPLYAEISLSENT